MHRQAPLAIGALAACAAFASGSVLLRDQILTFTAWPGTSDGSPSPEIAIPHGLPLAANGGAPGPVADDLTSRTVRRSPADRALLNALGLGPGGGTLALGPNGTAAPTLTTGPASSGGGTPRTPVADGPTLTTTGPAGSGTPPTTTPGEAPLAGYGGDGPVTGDAAPTTTGSGTTKPGGQAGGPSIFTPTTPAGTARPQVADTAPAADPAPVNSATDNAPKPSDDGQVPAPSDPAPAPSEPAPADPAPPAEPTPSEPAPADPAPPSEPAPSEPAPADPTPSDPAPADPAPPAEPTPTDPAPADPTPPADPAPTPDPAPVAPDAGAQTAAAAIPSSAQ